MLSIYMIEKKSFREISSSLYANDFYYQNKLQMFFYYKNAIKNDSEN